MKKTPVHMRVDSDVLARVDAEAKRLGQSRTTFVERSLRMALEIVRDQEPLESALGSSSSQASKAGIGRAESGTDGPRTSSAPTRASKDEKLAQARQGMNRADIFRQMTERKR